MARTHEEMMASLPTERRARIKARAAGQLREIEGLKALRKLAARSQEQIAQSLGIKQPSVLKIERQTDLYLSTLRRFVEAGKMQANWGLWHVVPQFQALWLTGDLRRLCHLISDSSPGAWG